MTQKELLEEALKRIDDLSDEEFSRITQEIIQESSPDSNKDIDDFYTWRLALYWFNYDCIQDGINVINNCWVWISLNPYQPKEWC